MKQTRTNDADPNPSSHTVDEMPTLQYAIAVSDTLQQRRTRTLKHGDMFAVFDHRGDMGGEPGNSEGLYYRDTRMLSQFQLLLEEARPLLLSSMTQDDNAVFSADLSNPDLLVDGKIALRRENVHVNRTRFIWSGACYERLQVRNFSDRPLQLRLTYRFASDFADLFEVRGEHRAARGQARAALESDHGVALTYAGLDRMERSTHIDFSPSPKTLTTARAVYELLLKPRATRRIFVRCAVDRAESDWGGRLFYRRMRAARQALRESSQRAASIEGSNSVFNEIMRRSVSDLYMLITDTPQGPYPYAGIPWFSTPFGRDAIITALMTLWLDPAIAKGVLKFLAYTQATTVEPERDAEPGKILHEMRHGEMANLREVPFGRYYGSVDATPLFVLLLGEYFRRTADLETVRSLWPNAQAALEWIDRYGDRDGDGFLEYHRQTKEGLANQGWKDSYDAIFHHDGRMAQGPIALCEVQAYVYGAKRHAATMAEALGHRRARRGAGRASGEIASGFRESLLVRGTLGVCPRARRREGALPRRFVELGTGVVHRHRIRRAGAARCADAPRAADVQRLGYPHGRCRRRRAITPCHTTTARSGRTTTASLPWALPATGSSKRPLRYSTRCSMRQPTWTCAACPSFTAASCDSRATRRRSIRSPAHPRLGRAPRRCACCKPRSGSSFSTAPARSNSTGRPCRTFSITCTCATCA